MARFSPVLAGLTVLLLIFVFSTDAYSLRHKREEHALIKVIKSHAHIRPPRTHVPTVSYIAPPAYYPIGNINPPPYTSGAYRPYFAPPVEY